MTFPPNPYQYNSQLAVDGTKLEDRLQQSFDALFTNALSSGDASGSFLGLSAKGTARKVAMGVANVAFVSPATQATVTVTHGLGVTPINIQLTIANIGANHYAPQYDSAGSTTFRINLTAVATFTASQPVSWIAIG